MQVVNASISVHHLHLGGNAYTRQISQKADLAIKIQMFINFLVDFLGGIPQYLIRYSIYINRKYTRRHKD